MAGSQIPTSVTILNSLKGYQAVSLTEYNTSASASIAAGSVVEIAGAFFTFVSDEAINASSWTAIVTGTTAYITLTPSGTAGSQIVDVAYTSTAPTWRDDHQGWYASAASNVRVIGSVYKAEASNYAQKNIYARDQVSIFPKIKTNGINLIPYRVTTESYIKASYTTDVFTACTAITTYAALNGYVTFSTASTLPRSSTAYVSANTIYISSNIGSSIVTNATFIVSYLY